MKFIWENWSALLFTVFIHTVVLAMFALNIDFERSPPELVRPVAVQASVVNGAAIDAEVKRQKKINQDKLDAEVKRQKDLNAKALQAKQARELEEQRLAELEVERKKQIELDKKTELEQKRLADLEAKRKSEAANLEKIKAEQLAAKKQAEEEEKIRVAAEAKKKADAQAAAKAAAQAKEAAAAAAEAQRVAQLEAELGAAMADEENYNNALASGELDKYVRMLSQHIIRNWRPPPTVEEGLYCKLDVRQIPGGDVVSVSFVFCNGDDAVKDSIEQAVYRASPLPSPDDRSVFNPDLSIDFKPDL